MGLITSGNSVVHVGILKELKENQPLETGDGTAERWNISIYFYPISRYI